MTREEALDWLWLQHSGASKENFDLAIAALEGKCEGCGDRRYWRDRLTYERESNRSLRSQLNAAEEALKAMEYSRRLWWHCDYTPDQLQSDLSKETARADNLQKELAKAHSELAVQDLTIDELKAELAAAERQQELEYEAKLDKLSELAALREKVRELLVYIRHYPGSDIHRKAFELFPDPAAEPEPKDWAWALEEWEAGHSTMKVGYSEPDRFFMDEGGWLYYETPTRRVDRYSPTKKDLHEKIWLPFAEGKRNEKGMKKSLDILNDPRPQEDCGNQITLDDLKKMAEMMPAHYEKPHYHCFECYRYIGQDPQFWRDGIWVCSEECLAKVKERYERMMEEVERKRDRR